jgi:hypothetical protein
MAVLFMLFGIGVTVIAFLINVIIGAVCGVVVLVRLPPPELFRCRAFPSVEQ